MEIGTVFYLFIIIIIFSHCTRWWWWYSSILLKVQIHIYMYSKLDITAKVTIPKTVLQSSAGCTLWLKVETVFSFVFFFFFSFLFFLSCGLSDGDLVVSFICFIRYCWKHSQCLWVLWLQYCVDCGSQKWSFLDCGTKHHKYFLWVWQFQVLKPMAFIQLSFNFFSSRFSTSIRCWSNTSGCDFFFWYSRIWI